MIQAKVEIFDPLFRTQYPKDNILVGNHIGYFVHNQIPFYFEIDSSTKEPRILHSPYLPLRELLQASIVLSKKPYSFFVFPNHSPATIHINTEDEITPEHLMTKVGRIIDGDEIIPILYNPYKLHEFSEALRIIDQTRSEKEYIDLFHSKQLPFQELISLLNNSFEFSEFEVNHISIASYYNLLLACPRYLHIALYYIINAARLMGNFFIEDAAINLNLASEAVFKDFMEITGIQNKKTAVEKLLVEGLNLAEEKVDWLHELYEARNEFLAHIDEDMFTPSENINDPDKYFYDHYGEIIDLVINYLEYRKDLIEQLK
jgi:hypothetical protein